MPIPTLDFETYSEAGYVWSEPSEKYPLGRWVPPLGADKPGLSAVGSAVYAQHPSTEVLTCSYDLCDGRGIRRWQPDKPLPRDLFDHVTAGRPLESHNAMFERLIWTHVCTRLYGWPPLPAEVQRCSMATAHVAQYPGALGNLGDVLNLTEKKDKRGEDLIKRFCVPQQPIPGLVDKRTGKVKREDVLARRVYSYDDSEGFEELCAYCDQDVRTEMAAADRMPPMEPDELSFWQIDQEVNYRGLGVDRPGLRACIDILGQVLEQYGAECEQITGFKVTQLQKLIGWIGAHGVHTTSLDAPTTAMLLERPDLPAPVERVLRLRQATGSASVKKTYAMENQCADDDRLRNLIVHHGARTGRPTGEGPQPLNLPKAGPKLVWCECGRPHALRPFCPWCNRMGRADRRAAWQPEMVDHVLEIMQLGSLSMVEHFFGDAMQCIQGCVRGLFVAAPEHDLVASDYSAIEAVVAAMLAGEQWRIEAFERGDPIYLVGASKITGKPLQFYLDWYLEHGEHHPDRQYIGKVSELACGFGGWINSYKAFGSTEPDEVIRAQILAWRAASPAIVEAWGGQWRGPPWRRERQELFGFEGMFVAAVQNPGLTFTYRGIRFCMEEQDCLVVRLLSGRPLRYRSPRLHPSARNPDELTITYMTWNSNPKYGAMGWVPMNTYGGRIFENIVQAVAHDVQRHGIRLLRQHGYPLVLGVYDEDVVEVPKDKQPMLGLAPVAGLDPLVQEVEYLMGQMPPWAAGWPIHASGGWRGRRYRKG